jgi:hypothetical protein
LGLGSEFGLQLALIEIQFRDPRFLLQFFLIQIPIRGNTTRLTGVVDSFLGLGSELGLQLALIEIQIRDPSFGIWVVINPKSQVIRHGEKR